MDEVLDAAGESEKARAGVLATQATLWAREGRHAEAAQTFARVERDVLDGRQRFMALERWAFSLVMLDESESAMELARQAGEELGALDTSLPRLAGTGVAWHGTLGAALVIAGKHAEAVPIIEAALAQPGSAAHEATVAFFLGEARAALGSDGDAAELWERASRQDPSGEVGARARARLDEPRSAYRGHRPS